MEELWTDYNTKLVQQRPRMMIRNGIIFVAACLIGIGLGVALERGWTAHNVEAVKVAK